MASSLPGTSSIDPSSTSIPVPFTGVGNDPLAAARPYVGQVLAMTREVFGDEPSANEREDAEIAGDWMFVVTSPTGGTADEIYARCSEWHSRLGELPFPARLFFCLSIEIREQ